MVYEDFTTYTEVDPNSHLSKTTNHVDHKGYRNEDCYLYKDYGTGHFVTVNHKIDAKAVSAGSKDYSMSAFWMLSYDTVDDVCGLQTGSKSCFGARLVTDTSGTKVYFQLFETYGGSWYTSAVLEVSFNTQYYCTITKSGTTLTLHVYTDSARTQEVSGSPKTLTLHANYNCQYLFAGNVYNYGVDTDNWIDVDIDNLDLQKKEWFLSETWQTTIYVWK